MEMPNKETTERIKQLAAAGNAQIEIAKILNKENIAAPGGGTWQQWRISRTMRVLGMGGRNATRNRRRRKTRKQAITTTTAARTTTTAAADTEALAELVIAARINNKTKIAILKELW